MTNVTLDDILHVVNIMAQARGINEVANEGFNALIKEKVLSVVS